MISTLIFTAILSAVSYLSFIKYREIYRNIQLGQPYSPKSTKSERIKTMLLIAFGQKKMFNRPLMAIFHLMIYVAFVFTQIELIEIILDGLLGSHRLVGVWMFHNHLGGIYTTLINFIELLSVLALIATFVFLARRDLLKLPRLNKKELNGWPNKDAHIILFGEIFLVFCIFLMNSTDTAIQFKLASVDFTNHFILSELIAPIWMNYSIHTLEILEKIGWWGHLLGIFGFILYLPYSKHLHILLAFPNTYFTDQNKKGFIPYMPSIFNEIQSMMNPEAASSAETSGEIPKFGAKDVMDLSWKSLLDAYTCTECGRCSSACPANTTGKLLSPRKIMMDTRDRLMEVGQSISKNKGEWKDDGKSLLHDYISVEELRACTTCNACVEECPVNISPLNIIIELRRSLIMEESNSTPEWNNMFSNIENNGAPWKFPSSERADWAKN
jgi:heterodisulfide reductase subunit C